MRQNEIFLCPRYRVSTKKSPVGIESMKEIRENFLQRWTISSLCIFYSTIFFYRSMDVRNFINGLILTIERYYRENRDSRN